MPLHVGALVDTLHWEGYFLEIALACRSIVAPNFAKATANSSQGASLLLAFTISMTSWEVGLIGLSAISGSGVGRFLTKTRLNGDSRFSLSFANIDGA